LINQQSHKTNRVLIADDDPGILDVVKTLVEREGYEAVTAENGRDAYRILQRDADFRVVILDMIMPILEGSDLLHEMQTEKRLRRIPVIIMSSSENLSMLSKGLGNGAAAFVPKPFTPDQMCKVLRIVTLNGGGAPPLPVPAAIETVVRPIAKPLKVLLVEDNPGEAIVIESVLLKAVAEIQEVSSIAITRADLLSGGIERIKEGDIDIVFLDLSLPDSDGLETLRRMLEPDPGVPVVVLTGMEDEANSRQAMKLGAQDYLVKGKVDELGMIRAVRYAFETRRESPHFGGADGAPD
jgi:CheY-like chemotaxis protein